MKALKGATSSEEVAASQYSSVDDPAQIDLLISNIEVHLEKLATEKQLNSLNLAGKFDKN